MSRNLPITAALTFALGTVLACDREPFATSSEPTTEAPLEYAVAAKAAVDFQGLVDAQFAAWTAKDADAFASTYTTDARFFNPIGAVYEGREGIRAAHALLFGGPFAPTSETQVITEVRMLTGTLGIVHLRAALTGFVGLPPGLTPTEPGVLRTTKTWVVEKRAGEWKTLVQHMAPIGPSL
jgi:uncharacterized protein (TIGR02246 family)